MLYAGGQAIGVIEAKPEGHTLTGVELQSAKYVDALPADLPTYRRPLPFAYESTGTETQFTNILDADARSREVYGFHRPDELIPPANLDQQVRTQPKHMPPRDVEGVLQVIRHPTMVYEGAVFPGGYGVSDARPSGDLSAGLRIFSFSWRDPLHGHRSGRKSDCDRYLFCS